MSYYSSNSGSSDRRASEQRVNAWNSGAPPLFRAPWPPGDPRNNPSSHSSSSRSSTSRDSGYASNSGSSSSSNYSTSTQYSNDAWKRANSGGGSRYPEDLPGGRYAGYGRLEDQRQYSGYGAVSGPNGGGFGYTRQPDTSAPRGSGGRLGTSGRYSNNNAYPW
ncbi:hypothetical protein BJ508DRAFT_314545 [Ascobolus immersus RN42]|uniref:Uncharacterized protein n=1 Tax=Ascobolus immersus RN42 TaxID=1160509 RepID=A0A3N4HI34_ASCIM|nr:hypothetical protein BJ508DRAFT_314545 [Ascobolus immersus RN42]